jgi:N-acetylmuramoyl-L-alanine amidase
MNNIYHQHLSRYQQRSFTRRLFIHHTASPANGTAADIRRWHLARNWVDGGYHIVIRSDGSIEYLRPIWAVGAHVGGHNSDSIGIALVGDFRKAQPTEAQLRSLKTLVVLLREVFPQITTVLGHRDAANSECPALDVAAWLRSEGL